MTKEDKIVSLFSKWEDCSKCPLGASRKERHEISGGTLGNISLGEGNTNAEVFILGTAPTVEEDRLGRVFVGESSDVIEEYLDAIGLHKKEVFMMNTVACRSFSIVQKDGKTREENRDPSTAEKKCCRPLWEEAIYIIDPLIILGLGKVAIQELSGKPVSSIQDIHGSLISYQTTGKAVEVVYPVMCLFHPTFLLRSGDKFYGGPWHKQLMALRKTQYILDKLKNKYYGKNIPRRDYTEKDLVLTEGGLPK